MALYDSDAVYAASQRKIKFIEETLFVGRDLALLAGRFQFNNVEDDGSPLPLKHRSVSLSAQRWRPLPDPDTGT